MTFITTTPKGTEGCNISYSEEERCAEKLSKVLPSGWKTSFNWMQIMFSDVAYEIDKKKKTIYIAYNQNLRIWTSELVCEIAEKVK